MNIKNILFFILLLIFTTNKYAFAELSSQTSTSSSILCPDHAEHDEDCAFRASQRFSPCTHEHTNCFNPVLNCAKEHDHISLCYKENYFCSHKHDEACGYVEEIIGYPCSHTCKFCHRNEPIVIVELYRNEDFDYAVAMPLYSNPESFTELIDYQIYGYDAEGYLYEIPVNWDLKELNTAQIGIYNISGKLMIYDSFVLSEDLKEPQLNVQVSVQQEGKPDINSYMFFLGQFQFPWIMPENENHQLILWIGENNEDWYQVESDNFNYNSQYLILNSYLLKQGKTYRIKAECGELHTGILEFTLNNNTLTNIDYIGGDRDGSHGNPPLPPLIQTPPSFDNENGYNNDDNSDNNSSSDNDPDQDHNNDDTSNDDDDSSSSDDYPDKDHNNGSTSNDDNDTHTYSKEEIKNNHACINKIKQKNKDTFQKLKSEEVKIIHSDSIEEPDIDPLNKEAIQAKDPEQKTDQPTLIEEIETKEISENNITEPKPENQYDKKETNPLTTLSIPQERPQVTDSKKIMPALENNYEIVTEDKTIISGYRIELLAKINPETIVFSHHGILLKIPVRFFLDSNFEKQDMFGIEIKKVKDFAFSISITKNESELTEINNMQIQLPVNTNNTFELFRNENPLSNSIEARDGYASFTIHNTGNYYLRPIEIKMDDQLEDKNGKKYLFFFYCIMVSLLILFCSGMTMIFRKKWLK